jgi:hypothetical protein
MALAQDGCAAPLSPAGVTHPRAGIGPTAQAAVESTAAGKPITEIIYNDCTH